jgi:hypothetical protein
LNNYTKYQFELQSRFIYLTKQWKNGTLSLSPSATIEFMTEDDAYRKIISMGHNVVPLILSELDKEVDHWFMALYEIMGFSPIKPANMGNLDKMAKDWIEWGRNNGYYK